MPVAVSLDGNRRLFDPEELPEERAECCRRATEPARKDLAQLLHLLATGAVVEKHAQPPVSVRHVWRRVADEHEGVA